MTTETKKITLNVPRVTFIEESHQYFIGKKELKGVTGTLIKPSPTPTRIFLRQY